MCSERDRKERTHREREGERQYTEWSLSTLIPLYVYSSVTGPHTMASLDQPPHGICTVSVFTSNSDA